MAILTHRSRWIGCSLYLPLLLGACTETTSEVMVEEVTSCRAIQTDALAEALRTDTPGAVASDTGVAEAAPRRLPLRLVCEVTLRAAEVGEAVGGQRSDTFDVVADM